MNPDHIYVEILFSRLSHPSGMVRERACIQIAQLLQLSASADVIRDRLFSWISEQKLESVCIIGLLVLHRLRIDFGMDSLLNLEHVNQCIRVPSLLSWMLLKELFGEDYPQSDWRQAYSGHSSPSFVADPFFEKYVRSFLPPIYWDNAKEIDHHYKIEFTTQWSWEWTNLLESVNVEKNIGVFTEWGRPDDKHYLAVDSKMSEVYRSSYLRTLAWAVSNKLMVDTQAERFAAQACPIDLGLWTVSASHKPIWVPQVEIPKGLIDTTHADTWTQVEHLWNQRVNEDGMVIIEAGFPLTRSKNLGIDFSIIAVLQTASGPVLPDLVDVINWCKHDNYLGKGGKRPLHFGGELKPASIVGTEMEFGAWTLWPTATKVFPITAPRWQWWRMFRGLWFPSLHLFPKEVLITLNRTRMEFWMEHTLIGYWSDWVIGLREMRIANLPPSSGQALWISQSILKDLEEQRGLRFCWICEIETFHRKYTHEQFQRISTQRQYGASLLVTP